MKDNDLQEPLYLSHEDQEQLYDQIVKDSVFLQCHDIMDYSLLLGVRKGISEVQTNKPSQAKACRSTAKLCRAGVVRTAVTDHGRAPAYWVRFFSLLTLYLL